MSDDLKTAKTALAKLHQDMEAINLLAEPSYLHLIKQMECVLVPINRQLLEFSRAFEMSGVMSRIQEIASANQHWQELIKQPLRDKPHCQEPCGCTSVMVRFNQTHPA